MSENQTKKCATTKRLLVMTVDPMHVGTGGMRLGRVDNSIVREPGTRLPKIPGSALHGAIRQYAAYRYHKLSCAGKKGHCGRPTCPICYTFGFVKGTDTSTQSAHSGVVSIGDAQILLFPVYSMAGPVWVTSPAVLTAFGLQEQSVASDKAKWTKGITEQDHLNLGWLMVATDGDLELNGLQDEIPEQMQQRVVMISDKLFSQVVNSNLEVRTSVSINPETGAAEEGALFTYEAIPRTTVLFLDVVEDDYRGAFPSKSQLEEWKEVLTNGDTSQKKDLLKNWRLWQNQDDDDKLPDAISKALNWIDDDLKCYGPETLPIPKQRWLKGENGVKDTAVHVVAAGLEWAEHLGIGGMGTRGFGRIRSLLSPNEKSTEKGGA